MGILSGLLGASLYLSGIEGSDRITKTSGTPCELSDGVWVCKTSNSLAPGITDFTEQGDAITGALSNKLADQEILFDFTTIPGLDTWEESSDTARDVGMSKASFVLQKTQKYQRAIFFALLNPQPSGACFAGVVSETNFDSSEYKAIWLKLRGVQGELWRYKVILRNQEISNQRDYEAFFMVDTTACNSELEITLPLDEFKAYYRGKPDPDAPPLNSSNVIGLGIQAAGGVYETVKQSGAGAIEIDWIILIN